LVVGENFPFCSKKILNSVSLEAITMSSDGKSAAPEVSKTAMLRGVVKDVATLRADLAASLQTIESISTWAKSTVKPGMQQLQGMSVVEP
jgi:hypothetical protein